MAYRPVGLERQQTYKAFTDNRQYIQLCWSIIFVGPAIAGIVIAINYDSGKKVCNLNIYGFPYLIPLDVFLFVGGIVQIINCIVHSSLLLCKTKSDSICYKKLYTIYNCLILIFLIIWSSLGLVLVFSTMTDECRVHHIGIIILSWCIINLIYISCICCGLLCMMYMISCVVLTDQIVQHHDH